MVSKVDEDICFCFLHLVCRQDRPEVHKEYRLRWAFLFRRTFSLRVFTRFISSHIGKLRTRSLACIAMNDVTHIESNEQRLLPTLVNGL